MGGSDDSTQVRPPTVLWAQRANLLYLTVTLEDCKNPTIKLDSNSLFFQGKSESLQQDADHNIHEVKIEFFKPIKPDSPTKYITRDRGTEFVIYKEEEEWWPRLLKDGSKQHWLKSDFAKWKDEDDSDDEAAMMGGMGGGFGGPGGDNADLSALMRSMMQGENAGGGMPAMDNYEDAESGEEEDSDDEAPPELVE